MKWWIITLISIITISTSFAQEPNKIVIIDTGLDLNDPRFKYVLCETGHKDFTETNISDINGHGTHIAGLIKQYAGDSNYCLIILKFYHDDKHRVHFGFGEILFWIFDKIKPKIVNISAGGRTYLEHEYNLFKLIPALFITAVGNQNQNQNIEKFPYYPAAYNLKNIVAVGNLNKNGKRNKSSNYGKKVVWEIGTDVLSTCPNNTECVMSGSSQATAVYTGKLIRKLYENR